MTTLETLARDLAADPDDAATLAAFVDCLKEADGSQAMEALRLLLPQSDVPQTPAPVQPAAQPLHSQRDFREYQEITRLTFAETTRLQRERDERILQCTRLAIGITAAVIAITLSFLGF